MGSEVKISKIKKEKKNKKEGNNMTKAELIYKFLTENFKDKEKTDAIKALRDRFSLNTGNANTYYHSWKRELAKQQEIPVPVEVAEDIPAVVSDTEAEQEAQKKKIKVTSGTLTGEYDTYIVEDGVVNLHGVKINTVQDVQEFRAQLIIETEKRVNELMDVLGMVM